MKILPFILFFCAGVWCLYAAYRGLKTRTLIFKKGTKGTGLENNKILIWAQIIGTFALGFAILWNTIVSYNIFIAK
ncbi:MAG: hypothetical protein H6754_00905 [Candidatus Omnitrophica bacterium]|nr:hypothetical protein [Candidatus Omnitrophota bacterium]